MQQKAVVLLSGGLDSSTVLAIAHQQGFELHTLAFDYGQRHQREVKAAAAIARHYNVLEQKTVRIDLRAFGGSALTSDIAVPHSRSLEEMAHDIPITYVPARNTIFLSFALAYAEVSGANDIFLGINAIDYSGYPDCLPSTWKRMNIWRTWRPKPALKMVGVCASTRPCCIWVKRTSFAKGSNWLFPMSIHGVVTRALNWHAVPAIAVSCAWPVSLKPV